MATLFPGKSKGTINISFALTQVVIKHSAHSKSRTFITYLPHLLELSPLSLVPKGVTRSFNLLLTSCQAPGKLARTPGNSRSQTLNASLQNEESSAEK